MRPAQKWISDYVAHMCGNMAERFQNYLWKNNICTLEFASFDIIYITCYGEHITKIKTEKLTSVTLNTINVGSFQPATIISVL